MELKKKIFYIFENNSSNKEKEKILNLLKQNYNFFNFVNNKNINCNYKNQKSHWLFDCIPTKYNYNNSYDNNIFYNFCIKIEKVLFSVNRSFYNIQRIDEFIYEDKIFINNKFVNSTCIYFYKYSSSNS